MYAWYVPLYMAKIVSPGSISRAWSMLVQGILNDRVSPPSLTIVADWIFSSIAALVTIPLVLLVAVHDAKTVAMQNPANSVFVVVILRY